MAMSAQLLATRGITAGSGLATTELRVLLIDIIDAASRPGVTITLYVDDVAAEATGTQRTMLDALVPCVLAICDRMSDDLLQVSDTKCVCSASTDAAGRRLEERLHRYAIRYQPRVKSLGAGLGGGTRRHVGVTRTRLRDFRRRIGRFRRLRRTGVDTARLLRTGGTAAMTYGQAVMGVSDAMLLGQRRAAMAASAPAAGTAGQQLDLALMLADASRKGQADPAYQAHLDPIGAWADAVWEEWLPGPCLLRLTGQAKVKLAAARRQWAVVRGPAAAFVASAARLGWTVHDAFSVTTDTGMSLRLHVDPPVVIRRACHEAVWRWRMRSIERQCPSLDSGGKGLGPDIEPILRLLRSREKSEHWNADYRGALASAVANRQWPQERCAKANMAPHNKCLLCVHALGLPVHDPMPPASAPVGNGPHRAFGCPQMHALRVQCSAPPRPAGREGELAHRALLPSGEDRIPPPAAAATFHWLVKPVADAPSVRGKFYTDGSGLDGRLRPLGRLGWSFQARCPEGRILAAAHGLPPPWITDVPGSEAWALLQAAQVADVGSEFRIDCQEVVKAMHRGRTWATSAKRPLARVFNLVLTAADDFVPEAFVWMPAHTTQAHIGRVRLGDGSLLTYIDHCANDGADAHAKSAVEEHRVPLPVRRAHAERDERTTRMARWIGRVTYEANHRPTPPHRDSVASRAVANQAARARTVASGDRRHHDGPVVHHARPVALGGHHLSWTGRSWECAICRRHAKRWGAIAPRRCPGSAALLWAQRAEAISKRGGRDGGGHRRMLSADVVWCDRCGAYATVASRGLTAECPGLPSQWKGGGRPQQLAALRAGKHPKTGDCIGAPCPEPRWDLLATDAGEALAVPRIARGFLAQRHPAHRRQACVDPPLPGEAQVRLASALTSAVMDPAAGAAAAAQPRQLPAGEELATRSPAPVVTSDDRRAAIYARVRARLATSALAVADVAAGGDGGAQMPSDPGGARASNLVRRRCRAKSLPPAWR